MPKSHVMSKVFKAYKLIKKENLSFTGHARIGRFQDVCFVGSQVLTMPNNVNYKYDYMKTGNDYKSL